MSRIITDESNKKLHREYRLRFLSMLFFILTGVIVINVLLISTSYLLLTLYERAYTTESSSERDNEVSKMNQEFALKVTQVHALSQKIPSQTGTVNMNVAHLLFGYVREGIGIQAIEILPTDDVSNITLRGTATTRDVLLQFQNAIKQNPSFQDFSIPIESLAKQKDISFNVTFTYHEN